MAVGARFSLRHRCGPGAGRCRLAVGRGAADGRGRSTYNSDPSPAEPVAPYRARKTPPGNPLPHRPFPTKPASSTRRSTERSAGKTAVKATDFPAQRAVEVDDSATYYPFGLPPWVLIPASVGRPTIRGSGQSQRRAQTHSSVNTGRPLPFRFRVSCVGGDDHWNPRGTPGSGFARNRQLGPPDSGRCGLGVQQHSADPCRRPDDAGLISRGSSHFGNRLSLAPFAVPAVQWVAAAGRSTSERCRDRTIDAWSQQ